MRTGARFDNFWDETSLTDGLITSKCASVVLVWDGGFLIIRLWRGCRIDDRDRGPRFVRTSPSVVHVSHREAEVEVTVDTAAGDLHSRRRELWDHAVIAMSRVRSIPVTKINLGLLS